ncbi:MAG: RNA polymerase sigma factor [Eubacteriales bacterium]
MSANVSTRVSENSLDASAGKLDEYLEKIADGDREALAAIYQATSDSVYGYALSILKNPHDAQDVMQDCYLCIFSAAHMYHSEGKPMAWILTIVRNLCLKNMRGRTRTVSITDEDWNPSLQECTELSVEDRMMLSACMNSLGDDERQIVVLHAVSGLKHREIASLMELPLATVLSKYHRAIKKLKNAWEKGE